MGDGTPTITGPPYVRDPERVCFICEKKGCAPIEHVDAELSRFEAENLARECLDMSNAPRARMLARYILSLPK